MWDMLQNDSVAGVGVGVELKHDWPQVLETVGTGCWLSTSSLHYAPLFCICFKLFIVKVF